MRIMAVVTLLSLLWLAPVAAKTKSNFIQDAWKSVVLYELGDNGHCTAFAVRFDPPTYITASHCPPGGTVDGKGVTFLARTNELVAFTVENGRARPILILGSRPELYLETVYQVGFGGPFKIPFVYAGIVEAYKTVPYPNTETPMMMFSANGIGGMSGGPIINNQGHLVSVVLCGGSYTSSDGMFGCGASYEELSDLYRQVTAR